MTGWISLFILRLGASVTTIGSATTVPATESDLQLQAQLAAARAMIDALKAQQAKQSGQNVHDDPSAPYRRMCAELWDKPIFLEARDAHVPKLHPITNQHVNATSIYTQPSY